MADSSMSDSMSMGAARSLLVLPPILAWLDRYANQRRQVVPLLPVSPGDLPRLYAASESSLGLLLGVLRPLLWTEKTPMDLSPALEALLGGLETIIAHGTAPDQLVAVISAQLPRQCIVPASVGRALLYAALLSVLTALNDDALSLILTLQRPTPSGVTMVLDTDRPGLACAGTDLAALQALLAPVDGRIDRRGADLTWRLVVRAPVPNA